MLVQQSSVTDNLNNLEAGHMANVFDSLISKELSTGTLSSELRSAEERKSDKFTSQIEFHIVIHTFDRVSGAEKVNARCKFWKF